MFCKYCGKNIYDLEKCPFCEEGKKLTNEEKEDLNEASSQKNQAEKNKRTNYGVSPKTEEFTTRLKKENKGYRAINIIYGIVGGIGLGGLVLSIIVSFFENSIAGDGFFGVMLLGVYDYIPYGIAFFIAGWTLELVRMIVYVRAAKKKEPSAKELFADVYDKEDKEFFYIAASPAWEALSLRYDERYFKFRLAGRIVRLIGTIVSLVTGAFIIYIGAPHFGYGIETIFEIIGNAPLVLLPGFVFALNVFAVDVIIQRVIDSKRKKITKSLVARLKKGEFEEAANVNE